MKQHLTHKGALVSLFFLLPTAAAHAQSHGAHVHGEADIAVAIEGETVSVSIISAMYNITGFEHAPETEEQHEILDAAIARLNDGSELFEFNTAADCASIHSHHSLHAEETHEASDDDEHAHHDEDEQDEEHEGHEEHRSHDHDDHAGHRDLEAEYEFTCQTPDRLSSMEFKLFGDFGNLEKVNAILLIDGRQTAVDLTPGHRTLYLNGS